MNYLIVAFVSLFGFALYKTFNELDKDITKNDVVLSAEEKKEIK